MLDFGEEKVKKGFMIMNKIILIYLILIITSCKKDQNVNNDPIPIIPVNTTINLAIHGDFTLIPGSFFYENGGNKGFVVVHDFDGQIRVFDRTCSYQPHNDCSFLSVDSTTLLLKCGLRDSGKYIECCESKFNFLGQVLKGPATFPIYQYRTSISGSFLNVFN